MNDEEAVRNVADIIQSRLEHNPVLVISAAGDTTDTLLNSIDDALHGDSEVAINKINDIHRYHLSLAEHLDLKEEWLTRYTETAEGYQEELKEFMTGASLLHNLSPKSIDRMLPFGERYTSLLMTYYLNTIDIPSNMLDSTKFIVTTDEHTKAKPILEESKEKIRADILPVLEAGEVPVVQGFVGSTRDGNVSTLGRGGSDYTASVLGAALEVDDIEIWSDVDGILTADPTIIKDAKVVERMTFREAAELAYFGNRVLHPDSILPAVEQDIPLHIYNSKNPESPGSLIRASFPLNEFPVVKSIAYKEDMKVLNLISSRMFRAHDFLRKVFEILDRYEMVADLVSTSEVSVSIAFHTYPQYADIIKELSQFAQVSLETGKALVCLVGEKMKFQEGLPGKILGTLSDVRINMISQGASEVNLSFIINESDIDRVVKKLHSVFFPG